ncbi:MAG: cytochrome P450 [Deltaproteobacteria bacterium]|nr:cytochrome P450 [Deltaproteobacteria bacterium]
MLPHPDLPGDPARIFERILALDRRGDELPRLYDQLRAVAPVWRAPVDRLGRPWIITRHADASALVRSSALIKDERLLGLAGVGAGGPFIDVMRRMFAFQAPARHQRMRSLVNRGFTPRSIEKLRPAVQALVDGLLDRVEPRGEMDLVADFAFPLPVTVICRLLGAPVEDVPRIEGYSTTFARRADPAEALTPEMEKRGDDATLAFVAYVKALIAARRAEPADDLVSRLVAIQREAPELSDDDIAATTILLFQAGHETTTNLIAKGVLALLRQPDRIDWLRAHPEAIEAAVEELLRFDTAVQISTKYAARDIPFHDETIREGDAVTFVWGAINRDPAHFPDPHRLDFERTNRDHFSFGMGPNYCLGASLARLEIEHAVLSLIRRLPDLRLADEAIEYKPQLHLHGLARLRVAW